MRFRIEYAALSFCFALCFAKLGWAHELTDDELCKSYERKLYSYEATKDGPSFGDAVRTGRSYGSSRDYGYKYTNSFNKLLGREVEFLGSYVPLIAKLVPCEDAIGALSQYAEDSEYCIVPRMLEIENTDGFAKLLQENSERNEFREICPTSFSDTEKKLFFLDQKLNGINEVTKPLVSWLGTQLMAEAYRSCMDARENEPDFKARLAEFQAEMAINPDCPDSEAPGIFLALNSESCPEQKNDPRIAARKECTIVEENAPQVQKLLELYNSM